MFAEVMKKQGILANTLNGLGRRNFSSVFYQFEQGPTNLDYQVRKAQRFVSVSLAIFSRNGQQGKRLDAFLKVIPPSR